MQRWRHAAFFLIAERRGYQQKTVSGLAEEMYPLTTTNTGHGHDSSVRGNRVREHQCGSALRSSLPSTPPSPGHRPGVCPARCCGPASQAEAGRVAPAPLAAVTRREPRRTLKNVDRRTQHTCAEPRWRCAMRLSSVLLLLQVFPKILLRIFLLHQ